MQSVKNEKHLANDGSAGDRVLGKAPGGKAQCPAILQNFPGNPSQPTFAAGAKARRLEEAPRL
jgi:hypothetical protein